MSVRCFERHFSPASTGRRRIARIGSTGCYLSPRLRRKSTTILEPSSSAIRQHSGPEQATTGAGQVSARLPLGSCLASVADP